MDCFERNAVQSEVHLFYIWSEHKSRMDERISGILQIVFAIAIVLLVLSISQEIERFKELGYLGVFVISLLSAATIFIPSPGWAVVIVMATILDPVLVGIVGGVGAGLGEITGYIAGSGAKDITHANQYLKKYKEWIRQHSLLAVFVLAFIPNPFFDVAGLAAGTLGISWKRFLLGCIAGRTLRYVLLALLGVFSLQYI